MRVLLISTNRTRDLIPVTPLGAVTLASCLEAGGCSTRVLDLCFLPEALLEAETAVRTFRPDVIGVSVRNFAFGKTSKPELQLAREVVQRCRELTGAPVVLGGPAFSYAPRQVLAYCGADLGVTGDGEAAFPALLEQLAAGNGQKAAGIPGVVTAGGAAAAGDGPADLPAPALAEDLNRCSLTLVQCYDRCYLGWVHKPAGLPAMKVFGIQSRRGCPHSCLNCRVPAYAGSRLRTKAPELVLEELERLDRVWGIREFFLVDDLFNEPLDHLTELCEALLRQGKGWRWSCITCNHLGNLEGEIFALMRLAGCEAVILDVACAADGLLPVIGKDFTARDIVRCATLAQKAGVSVFYHLTLGFPGETMATVRSSLALMEEVGARHLPVIVGLAVYPGTELDYLAAAGRVRGENGPAAPDLYLSPGLDPAELVDCLLAYRKKHADWYFGSVFPAVQNWLNQSLEGGDGVRYGTENLLLPGQSLQGNCARDAL